MTMKFVAKRTAKPTGGRHKNGREIPRKSRGTQKARLVGPSNADSSSAHNGPAGMRGTQKPRLAPRNIIRGRRNDTWRQRLRFLIAHILVRELVDKLSYIAFTQLEA